MQRLQHLLGVLGGIPPRLRRSLEDYKLHEETMDLVQGALADIVSAAQGQTPRSLFSLHFFSGLMPLWSLPAFV